VEYSDVVPTITFALAYDGVLIGVMQPTSVSTVHRVWTACSRGKKRPGLGEADLPPVFVARNRRALPPIVMKEELVVYEVGEETA
jgi:hypothetical protein